MPVPFNLTQLKFGNETVLFEAGAGGQFQPTTGAVIANMAAAGIQLARITKAIVSHFHLGLKTVHQIAKPAKKHAWWASCGPPVSASAGRSKVEGRKSLTESRPEAAGLARKLSEQRPRLSLREIAVGLAAEGFSTPRGHGHASASQRS